MKTFRAQFRPTREPENCSTWFTRHHSYIATLWGLFTHYLQREDGEIFYLRFGNSCILMSVLSW
jgi:hypothetical protein